MWESILWFSIFGALFYYLMRAGGCGMHSHGGHGTHGSHKKPDNHEQGRSEDH